MTELIVERLYIHHDGLQFLIDAVISKLLHGRTKAVNHTLAVAFVTYALVVLWYLKHGEPAEDVARVKKEAPWYLHKRTPSFSDMLAGVRREIWAARFSAHPVFEGVCAKTRELLPGWMLAG